VNISLKSLPFITSALSTQYSGTLSQSIKASLKFSMSQKVPHTAPDSPPAYDNPVNIDPDPKSWSICQDTTITNEGKEGPTATAADLLSLPSEIISVIFCHACKPIHGNQKWQRDCYPLHLGQISRQYRQYAWVTSKLWTTIVIRFGSKKSSSSDEVVGRVVGAHDGQAN